METKKKCAHPSCACTAKSDSDYCSTYCEGEATTSDIVCSCGHTECNKRQGSSSPPGTIAKKA